MRRGFRILIWIVGVCVVLLLAMTIGVKLYLTKERILAWVIPPLEKQLHRQVAIADAGAGRLVLVGQQTWEPSATTTVWQVELPPVESTQ